METQINKNDKIGLRTPSNSYFINEDVILFRENKIHEGHILNPTERDMLEQHPKEEMYDRTSISTHEVYTRNNVISVQVDQASELKRILLEWDRQTKERVPKNRSPKDGFTLPDGSKSYPYKMNALEGVGEIDETTLKAMQQLGYIE